MYVESYNRKWDFNNDNEILFYPFKIVSACEQRTESEKWYYFHVFSKHTEHTLNLSG